MDHPAFLNGQFLRAEEARICALDRGFLFGDGVYEVIPAYGGRLFRLDAHLQRLARNLSQVRILAPHDVQQWAEILGGLMARAPGGDLVVYLQVTRGVAPHRDHAFPEQVSPTVFAMVSPLAPPQREWLEQGVGAVVLEDIRWRRCDIKGVSLLGSVLLRQQAVEQGAMEAVLIRDGLATEGAATNVFMVQDRVMITPPKGPELLPGITRDMVLGLAAHHGLPHREAPITREQLFGAHEVWITSSTKEVLAVTRLDGAAVGSGRPGAQWRRIHGLFQDYKATLRTGVDPLEQNGPREV
jgi:D-alanine transaminase